jgi:hypothetical protein
MGVSCGTDAAGKQRVTEIAVTGAGASGTLPGSIGAMQSLRRLSLQSNALVGPLPDMRPLSQLQRLELSANHLSGAIPLAALSAMPALTEIWLDGNNVSRRRAGLASCVVRADTLPVVPPRLPLYFVVGVVVVVVQFSSFSGNFAVNKTFASCAVTPYKEKCCDMSHNSGIKCPLPPALADKCAATCTP